MTDTQTELTPEACYDKAAEALRGTTEVEGRPNTDAANQWRMLGDSLVASRR